MINEKGLELYYLDKLYSNKKTFYSFQFSKIYESDLLNSEYLNNDLTHGYSHLVLNKKPNSHYINKVCSGCS